MDTQNCQFNTTEFAPWMQGAAFNAYKTYTFVNNSVFYASLPSYYREFMVRFVQNPLYWVDGWCPYFHNADKGVMSSRLAGAIVDRVAKKVSGSRIMYKTIGKVSDTDGINDSKEEICKWSDKYHFESVIKTAIRYAAAAGTSLLKLNKNSDGDLWGEAVRFDRFLPGVDASTGKVIELKCFLYTNVQMINDDDKKTNAYSLIEHRYFGKYRKVETGEVIENAPIVEYTINRLFGSITNNEFNLQSNCKAERVLFKNLPKEVRKSILDNYGTLIFDAPILLPFKDWLGCELVKWTEDITGIPQMPFGESLVNKIIPYLQEYDYLTSVMGTEMYLGRGRVLIPKGFDSGRNADGLAGGWDNALDGGMFIKLPFVKPEDAKPEPIQFEVRAEQLSKMRNTILEAISVNIGISPSTLAPFLQDSSARTAREVSTEENETACFVADTRSILETPINEVLRRVCLYYQLPDIIGIRWSQAGLSNPFMTTEMVTQLMSSGLISRRNAIAMLNPDEDDAQIDLLTQAAADDYNESNMGNNPFDEMNYYGDEGAEPASDIN